MSAEPGPPLVHVADGPADPGASRLEWLVHPLRPQAFVRDYWTVRPVLLTGWPERFAGLFDLAALRAAVGRQHEVGLSIRVSGDHRDDGGGAGRHVAIDAGRIGEHLRRGTSVCVDPVDRAVPALRTLAADLRRELRHAGEVNVKCYLSPDGYGFNAHFDAHVVTTLQIAGTKRWRLSRRPGVEHPVDNAFLDADGSLHYMHRMPSAVRRWERAGFDSADAAEVVLNPGDVLCLPPGTWHEAKAEGMSLALNVAFAGVDLLGLLGAAARDRLEERATWRAGLPVAPSAAADEVPGVVAARIREHVDRLVEVLSAPGFADEVGRAWLQRVMAGDDGAAPVAVAPGDTTSPGNGTPAQHRVQCVLPVADAARAADWYRRTLGLRPTVTIAEYGWIELATGVPGVTVGLTEATAGSVARLGLAVPDLAAAASALAAAGVRTGAERAVAGAARFLEVDDLDGNRLVLFEPERSGARGEES